MNDRIDVRAAIRRSIFTEKNAMDFYRLAAHEMQNPGARTTFERLAGEERVHAWWFYRIYRGGDLPTFDVLMEASPAMDSDWLADLEKILRPGLDEADALRLALDKEQRLERSLRETAAWIEDNDVRQVYLANAEATRQHYQMIAEAYARLTGSSPARPTSSAEE
jgi:rubrerythrin